MSTQLQSLTKGLQVYKEIINYGKPILASALCERLDINKSTMSRILQTLKEEDYITYLDNSNEIIPKSLEDKTTQKTKIQILVEKTKPILENIYELTNECAYFGVFDDYKVLYVNQLDKSNRIKTRNSIGLQAPLHTNALGKSILAFGNYDLELIKLNHYTHNTITDISFLEKTIDEVKENGYSIDNSEYQDNMCCVAVPLFNHENILIGAVGISGLKERLSLEKLNFLGKEISKLVSEQRVIC
ncbi:IclR family transcriptional regulator [Halarcobacter bivalviorum]|uniref:IclR family transcriptional regulator n=1 Tax=Halarcobacter bivalviorum TaxID=663364 RepID=A0AAX2A8G0_9BACT|nr:IclR family transcriptional regulator [Halarcobacter bivalviorum]AXH12549.1 transcriptional regulator, IclR family [Halarcobacter bivalviorum]RXK10527.1 IclR family transcriptional regulator [Halarcobacter bivalviorum]